ncbi:family 16 glycoside hydrolase [Parapedobacter tibetensis]|uniref:family 16 glycoside hydrolase n=1 Tax=Parapedobacter tibetensis TaxID=2972951 RepID=UPI00214DF05C|nr:family 16 glycoside hydrolase [Parapedobacter tibetensis]
MENLKKLLSVALAVVLFSACGSGQKAENDESATNEEAPTENDGWVSLFDGKTTKGWHTYLKDSVSSAWAAQDGELRFNPEVAREERGDIVTDSEYENFELELEWKISSGGNSGIIFGVHEDPKYSATYLTGAEMQVLDNIDAADSKIENHLAGTLYDMIGSTEVSKPKPVGEWNQARIRKNNGQITLWLNDVQTADVTIGTPEWEEVLNASKFKDWEGFAKYPKGKIALQDHGDVVAYRNIRIKEL